MRKRGQCRRHTSNSRTVSRKAMGMAPHGTQEASDSTARSKAMPLRSVANRSVLVFQPQVDPLGPLVSSVDDFNLAANQGRLVATQLRVPHRSSESVMSPPHQAPKQTSHANEQPVCDSGHLLGIRGSTLQNVESVHSIRLLSLRFGRRSVDLG